MKRISVLAFSLTAGILSGDPGMSQTGSSSSAIQGKTIHLAEVKPQNVQGKTSGANQTVKTKVRGDEFMTMNCYITGSDPAFVGPINAPQSMPQSSLDQRCNATYTDCEDSCLAAKNKREALKANAFKKEN